MMLLSKRTTLILLFLVVLSIAMLVTTNYTGACLLSEVTVDDQEIDGWDERLGLKSEHPVVRQPVETVVARLLASRNVFKVDLSYDLPGAIAIRTNNFSPVCFLVDAASGEMFGLTADARVVSLENSEFGWEHPVLTSALAGPLFGPCPDARVAAVVTHLEKLREDNIDLYRLINEIDFGYESFVQVALSGLPYRLKARAENFHDDMIEFVEFVSRFEPDLEGVMSIDLRFDDMIICGDGKG